MSYPWCKGSCLLQVRASVGHRERRCSSVGLDRVLVDGSRSGADRHDAVCLTARAEKPGTPIAPKAMIATTIMISTRVKPPRRLLSLFNMLFAFFLSLVCLTAIHDTDRGCVRF
jgi:hypothetical protein